jgi:hypothetical protein
MNAGRPERFEVDEQSGDLRIHWKWPAFIAIPLLLFSLAWDSFLVFWYFGAVQRGDPSLVELCLSSDREARFLEERLERRIGLANQPGAGELPR